MFLTKNYLMVVAFTLICGLSFSQNSNEQLPGLAASTEINHIVIDGTYQVILSDERMVEPELSDAILHAINNMRDEFKTQQMQLGEYARIIVLSFTAINAEDFVPLEKYRYED
ncbi:MAG: hypothetical protein ACI837_001307 [Crocinitomicaceae bacterium]|jgi:hypothetical protein